MKCRGNRTMLNFCGIVAAILKMAIGRNFSMSGINSGHHYLPIYQTRYDYNITIMKSPKPATDNRFKK